MWIFSVFHLCGCSSCSRFCPFNCRDVQMTASSPVFPRPEQNLYEGGIVPAGRRVVMVPRRAGSTCSRKWAGPDDDKTKPRGGKKKRPTLLPINASQLKPAFLICRLIKPQRIPNNAKANPAQDWWCCFNGFTCRANEAWIRIMGEVTGYLIYTESRRMHFNGLMKPLSVQIYSDEETQSNRIF